MKTFKKHYNIKEIDSKDFNMYFMRMKPCFFDIETTGLSPRTSKIVMTAMMIPDDEGWTVTQFLAEDHFEEHKVLLATMDFFKDEAVDYLITYNGESFDIPFMNARLEHIGFSDRLKMYNFDLYKFIRKETVLAKTLDSLSQKNIERYFGLSEDREDIISGADNARLFNEYVSTADSDIETIILTHNREDVFQLCRILNELSAANFSSYVNFADFHQAISDFGFPAVDGRFCAKSEFKPYSKQLRIVGTQIFEPFDALYFSGIDRSYSAEFKAQTQFFEIVIPVETRGDSAYVDLKALGLDNMFRELENCVNNYLILADEKKVYYHSINALGEAILINILDDIA